MITSKDISAKNFEKTKGFGGYRVDDVEDFMDQVAEYVAFLEEEKRDMENKLSVLAEKLEEYRADEDSLRTALLGAQKLGDGVIRESKTKADIILRDASIKAEKIINDAHSVVEDEERRLVMLKKDVSTFKQQMLELYRRHLEVIINSLPEDRTAAAEQPEPDAQQDPSETAEDRTMEFHVEDLHPQQTEQTTDEPMDAQPREPAYQAARENEIRVLGSTDAPVHESKFGPLKFGDKFSLTRNDDRRRK